MVDEVALEQVFSEYFTVLLIIFIPPIAPQSPPSLRAVASRLDLAPLIIIIIITTANHYVSYKIQLGCQSNIS
jgi:hypothetical protein